MNIRVNVTTSYSLDGVAKLFDEISEKFDSTSVFNSKEWFISWLENISYLPELCIFTNEQESSNVIGVCFVGKKRSWYGDVYILNQTGISSNDQMCIEHNHIFCHSSVRKGCMQSLLNTLCRRPRFHRLLVSNTCDQDWMKYAPSIWSFESEDVRVTDLDSFRVHNTKIFSKNLRNQINRATKYVKENIGQIEVTVNTQRIKEGLKTYLSDYHLKRWSNSEYGSGFANPTFLAFHESLVSKSTPLFTPECLEFRVNNEILACLYMFVHENSVMFYLSSINYELANDKKYKPGIVAHALAIAHYAERGYNAYDFLAGDAQYKRSLSNASYKMHTVEITTNSFRNLLLRALKFLKDRFRVTR